MSTPNPTALGTAINADTQELEKWSDWGAAWWQPTGEFRMLHKVNPVRLGYIQSVKPLAGARALDVGCGGGILAESMAVAGARVLGIDLADGVLSAARAHSQHTGSGAEFRKIPVETLAEECPSSFELVTCMEMLEHVPDPAGILASIGRLVEPGGHVVVSTLNRSLLGALLGVYALEYALRLVPVGTHDWRRFIQPAELDLLLRKAGLTPVAWKGILYNPVTERFWIGESLHVNYLVHARRL